jgi:hypothetical protein
MTGMKRESLREHRRRMVALVAEWEKGSRSTDIRTFLQDKSGCSYAEASRYARFFLSGSLLAEGERRSYYILMPEVLRQRIETLAVQNNRTLSEQVIRMLAQGCVNEGG